MKICESMLGYIHSVQSLGTVDGPGVRAVVFTEGCPLRCVYCHNPDTWTCRETDKRESSVLTKQILRLYPYIKNGGVTFSGGEPLLQASYLCEIAAILRERGLHIALDTCGCVDPENPQVSALLNLTDLVLLDVKMTTEETYRNYTGGSLAKVMAFLTCLEKLGKETWIRHVVVPGLNDNEADILQLAELVRGYGCVTKIELLPYKSLCLEKYRNLGIPYPLEGTPQMDEGRLAKLDMILQQAFWKEKIR